MSLFEEVAIDTTPSFRVKEKMNAEIQRYKQIIHNHLKSFTPNHFVEYKSPSSHYILWYNLSSQYCVVTSVIGNLSKGTCLLYSLHPLRLVCIGEVRQRSVESLQIVSDSKELHKKEIAVMNLGVSSDRWEGEIRNRMPNGEVEFCNTNNELIYRGMTIKGYANGVGTAFYPGGGISYYGMWKGNQRHGFGKEYDQNGNFIRDGIWIEGKIAEYFDIVNDMNVDKLNLSHYPPVTRCMYIKDNIYKTTPLVIEEFPFLEAVFVARKSIHSAPVTLKNLPSLRKFVLEETVKVSHNKQPLLVRNCPKLSEIWLSVSFKHGVIQVTECFSHFRDRFVLKELKDSMKWEQTGEIDRHCMNRYFPPEFYPYMYEDGEPEETFYESNAIPKGAYKSRAPLCMCFKPQGCLCLDNTVEAHDAYYRYYGYCKKD